MKVKSAIKRHLSPVLLGATLSISFLSTACNSSSDANDAEASAEARAIPVQTVELQSDTIGDRTEFVGNLEAVKVVEVNPEIQGRIKKILKEFVYQVSNEPNENGQEVVNLTPVELGDIQDNSYQVVSGLEAGDRIAVSNILKLRDGAPIQPESQAGSNTASE